MEMGDGNMADDRLKDQVVQLLLFDNLRLI
jgi:hypothetical protein